MNSDIQMILKKFLKILKI